MQSAQRAHGKEKRNKKTVWHCWLQLGKTCCNKWLRREREHYSNNYNKPAQQQTEVECPCDNATGRNVELATVEREKKPKQDVSNIARLPELVATQLRIFAAAVQQLIMYET